MQVLGIVGSELQTCVQSLFSVLKYLPSDHIRLDVWPLICCANNFHEQDQNSMFYFTGCFAQKDVAEKEEETNYNALAPKPNDGCTAYVI